MTKNIGKSIRTRLLNLAKEEKDENYFRRQANRHTLSRYGREHRHGTPRKDDEDRHAVKYVCQQPVR